MAAPMAQHVERAALLRHDGRHLILPGRARQRSRRHDDGVEIEPFPAEPVHRAHDPVTGGIVGDPRCGMIDHARNMAVQQAEMMNGIGKIHRLAGKAVRLTGDGASAIAMSRSAFAGDQILDQLRRGVHHPEWGVHVHRKPLVCRCRLSAITSSSPHLV
jgi:hypothetical protein